MIASSMQKMDHVKSYRTNSLAHLAPQFARLPKATPFNRALLLRIRPPETSAFPVTYIVKPYSWEWRDTLTNQPHPGAIPLPF